MATVTANVICSFTAEISCMHIIHTDFPSTRVEKNYLAHFPWNTLHSVSTFRFVDDIVKI